MFVAYPFNDNSSYLQKVLLATLYTEGAATSWSLAIHEVLTAIFASFRIVTLSDPLLRLSHQLSPLADIASHAGVDTYEQT